jgi:hypothetical protein
MASEGEEGGMSSFSESQTQSQSYKAMRDELMPQQVILLYNI